FASAWGELRAALALARQAQRADRVDVAREHLSRVEGRLSRVTIVVPTDAAPTLEVRLDGIALTAASYGAALPVDPGQHTLEARAPGRIGWRTTVNVSPDARDMTVVVPSLAPAPQPAPGPAASAPSVSPIAVASGVAVVWLGLSAFWGAKAL